MIIGDRISIIAHLFLKRLTRYYASDNREFQVHTCAGRGHIKRYIIRYNICAHQNIYYITPTYYILLNRILFTCGPHKNNNRKNKTIYTHFGGKVRGIVYTICTSNIPDI